MFLTNDVLVEDVLDLLRNGQLAGLARLRGLGYLFANDVVTQLDTLIADEYGGSGYEFTNFVLALATERAIQELARIFAFATIVGHSVPIL